MPLVIKSYRFVKLHHDFDNKKSGDITGKPLSLKTQPPPQCGRSPITWVISHTLSQAAAVRHEFVNRAGKESPPKNSERNLAELLVLELYAVSGEQM
jgi:hypothetical protein